MANEEIIFECIVSADLFARAHVGVSRDETRYYLNGVHVSPAPEGGAILTATDGSMLISMYDPEAIITGDAIVQLNKSMLVALPVSGVLLEKRLLLVRVLKGGRGKAFVVDQRVSSVNDEISTHEAAKTVFEDPDKRVRAAQFGAINIDGTFPDWRRILPTDLNPDGPMPSFDQTRLARAVKALTRKRETAVTITPSRENAFNAPFLVTANYPTSICGFAIIMPVRTERAKTLSVPTWAKAAETPKAA